VAGQAHHVMLKLILVSQAMPPAVTSIIHPSIPTFNPSPVAEASRLDIPASTAALTPSQLQQDCRRGGAGENNGGDRCYCPSPFNPTASLHWVVNKILKSGVHRNIRGTKPKLWELADIDISPGTGQPPPPARVPAKDISQWVEQYFTIMTATLQSWFQEKPAELFAYQARILRAKRPGRWAPVMERGP